MANKKVKVNIPVPSTGVRQDVQRMLRDGTMASIGENCMYYDGVIRPRPALTKEVDDPATGLPIINQYRELYNLYSQAGAADHTIGSALATEDGEIIVAISDQSLDLSIDNGQTFTSGALTHPGSDEIRNLEEKNDFIWAFLADKTVYRAPVSGLPSSLSWTLVGTLTDITPTPSATYIYDEDHDAWLISKGLATSFDVIYDASTSPSLDQLDFPSFSGITNGAPCWVNKEYVVLGSRNIGNHEQYLDTFSLKWDTTDYAIGTSLIDSFELSSNSNQGVLPSGAVNIFVDVTEAIISIPETRDFIVAMFGPPASTSSQIGRFTLTSGGYFIRANYGQETLQEYIDKTWTEVTVDGYGDVADYAVDNNKITILLQPAGGWGEATSYPRHLSSLDNGKTWMTFFDQRVPSEELVTGYLLNSNSKSMLFVFVAGDVSVENYGILYSLSSSVDGFLIGDYTTAYQADMDDEDNVIFAGATHGIARLNRTTGDWDRITAVDSETIDGDDEGAPDGDWNDGGSGTGYDADVPPLGCYPDDDNYSSGVSIDADLSTQPWVFRTFESNAKTFLIGTNGQCYPICYHPDMPDGFARRLGEMTVDDPNYMASPLAGSAKGDLAPKAKCIATSANRVMLANNPAVSPFQISVSAFNDHDRAWGNEQEVLLGDTPGEIVSMNEINALQTAVYKEDAIYHAIAQTEFLDVSAPFRFELSKAGISGPAGPNCVLRNFDGRQIYLALDGGVYMYDGVAPLDAGRNVRHMIQDDINLAKARSSWGMVDRQRKLVWFFYPSNDGLVNKGIVVSTDQGYPWPVYPVVLPSGWNFTCGLEAVLSTDATLGDLGILSGYDDSVTLSSFTQSRHEMLVGMNTGVFLSQQYGEVAAEYTDDGVKIPIHLRTGWTTPGGAEVFTADTIHHLFECKDGAMQLNVRLLAQQIGSRVRASKWSPLYADKTQRRTQHRVSGFQFALDMEGEIDRLFSWGGGMLSLKQRGGR